MITFVGGKPVPIPLREETGFGFDMDEFERRVGPQTRLIIVNSPQNPTGGVLERDQLGRIAEAARRYRIPVLADEIYKAFLYEGEFLSITAFPGMKEMTIILDGFSNLRDDRLAARLRGDAARSRRARGAAHGELELVHGLLTQLRLHEALQGDQMPVQRMVPSFAPPPR